MSDKIDFGVDYSMVLENLMEEYSHLCGTSSCIPPSCIPCVIIPSENLYSKVEFLELQSKKQLCDNIANIVITNIPLHHTSIHQSKHLEKMTASESTRIFPIQYISKIKKLGLMY
jgi:hypothetical protein